MDVERQNGSRSGEQIVVTEIPYGQQKSTIIQRVANEARAGKINGVVDIVDESDRDGMRIVIQVSRQADPNDVLEMLVRRSTLRTTFGVNNLMLVPSETDAGRLVTPQVLPLKDILIQFVQHRLEVIQRRSRYELERRKARLHVVEGLLIALDNIDEVIDTIRRSRTTDTARKKLMRRFKLSEIQATAILDMQLRRLAAMERTKLKDEAKELEARIKYLQALLASEAKQLAVIVEETTEIRSKYATPRRTTIVDAAPGEGNAPITSADLAVPDHPQMVTIKTAGVQRCDASAYSYRIKTGVSSRAVTAHRLCIQAEPTAKVFFVSTGGRVWAASVGQIPQEARFGEFGLRKDERIVYGGLLNDEGCLVMGTVQGKVKRVAMPLLVEALPDGVWTELIGLVSGDQVAFAGVSDDKGQVLFFTNSRVLRIAAETISCQQTFSARGVAGIKLRKDDVLLGGAVVADPKGQIVLILSQKGYIKRVPLDEFGVKGRGSLGVLSLNATQATGPVVAAAVGKPGRSTSVDVLSLDGKRQRISLRGIPTDKRANRGKKLVQLAQANEIVIWQ
jgi:DNA gyrase subunit A